MLVINVQQSTLDKFVKADVILLWMGEGKYAELEPLQKTSSLGSLEEWQLLADCVQRIQQKLITENKKRKPKRVTPSVQKQAVVTTSCDSPKHKTRDLNYKQMHNDRLQAAKSPKSSEKILPRASGPSTSRITSQQMITWELLQKQ